MCQHAAQAVYVRLLDRMRASLLAHMPACLQCTMQAHLDMIKSVKYCKHKFVCRLMERLHFIAKPYKPSVAALNPSATVLFSPCRQAAQSEFGMCWWLRYCVDLLFITASCVYAGEDEPCHWLQVRRNSSYFVKSACTAHQCM